MSVKRGVVRCTILSRTYVYNKLFLYSLYCRQLLVQYRNGTKLFYWSSRKQLRRIFMTPPMFGYVIVSSLLNHNNNDNRNNHG